ncbi:unnamed protein product [Mytilus edulis]|uniref:Uncharacterized protein n=1 Tax=Mytilus edulis TaxID=6550 RepID=A0A8S3SL83_MYTED|nr:unnamed protein product [Mytilus edulis]
MHAHYILMVQREKDGNMGATSWDIIRAIQFGYFEIVTRNSRIIFNMIKTIFTNLGELTDKENKNKKAAEIIVTIKNMMTDRHIVNTSLKNLLEKWKSECLPLVIENYDTFNADMKKSLLDINHFKCNLHVLVNLGTQAEAALKEWAKTIIVSDTLPSDSFSHSTPDFIRASTKLCVPGADHKSGYGLLFNSYLESLTPPIKQNMSTFYGHRINVLFSMAASVFYHAKHIKEFIELYFDDKQNNLVSCVANYVNNNVYLAGCRALGIIDKLCTGPLWRQIEESKHILDLNNVWLNFYNFLDEFSKDSSDLLRGKVIYPDYTIKDEVYNSLFMDLVIIFPGGKFSVDSAENFENLKNISRNVSTTNIISERDFANLDRLTREKPNANTIAVEGIILFTNNKTLQWLDSLNPDKKTEVFKIARENAPKMIKNYRKQKIVIKEKHIELLNKRKEENLRLQQNKMDELNKIRADVEKIGGEWKCQKAIDDNLNNIAKSKKIEAVKAQIKFQRLILKKNPSDKAIFKFSIQGRQLELYELLENLTNLMQLSGSPEKVQQSSEILTNLIIKSKEEREQFMAEQRGFIMEKIKKFQLTIKL